MNEEHLCIFMHIRYISEQWRTGMFGRAGRRGSHVKDGNKGRKEVGPQCHQGYGVGTAQRLDTGPWERSHWKVTPNQATCAPSIVENAVVMFHLPAGGCVVPVPWVTLVNSFSYTRRIRTLEPVGLNATKQVHFIACVWS